MCAERQSYKGVVEFTIVPCPAASANFTSIDTFMLSEHERSPDDLVPL